MRVDRRVWVMVVVGIAAVAVFLLPFGAALLVPDRDEIAAALEEEDPMYECLEQARGTVSKSEAKTLIMDCRAQAGRIWAERDREAGVRPVGLPRGLPPAKDPNELRGGEFCAEDDMVAPDAETEERYGWMKKEFGYLPPEAGYMCVNPVPLPKLDPEIVD